MNYDPYVLQLIITKSCNLKCQYCYVNQRRDVMPVNVAKAAIMEAIENRPEGYTGLLVAFMGGEPLTEFELIREICQWCWDKYPEEDICFDSPTNGTILNNDIRNWLTDHKDKISFGLSYDGNGAQNGNRSNSNSRVETEFFAKTWPDHPWKMTISEHNLDTVADDIISLTERGILVSANCACGQAPWPLDRVQTFGQQMMKLASYFIKHPELPLPELLAMDLTGVLNPDDRPMKPTCAIGRGYITVDSDGSKYICHMFSPLALKADRLEIARQYNFNSRTDYTVSECRQCLLRHICPKCYGMSLFSTGIPFSRDINICRTFREQVKAACSYWVKTLFNKSSLDDNDLRIIAAIKTIMSPGH